MHSSSDDSSGSLDYYDGFGPPAAGGSLGDIMGSSFRARESISMLPLDYSREVGASTAADPDWNGAVSLSWRSSLSIRMDADKTNVSHEGLLPEDGSQYPQVLPAAQSGCGTPTVSAAGLYPRASQFSVRGDEVSLSGPPLMGSRRTTDVVAGRRSRSFKRHTSVSRGKLALSSTPADGPRQSGGAGETPSAVQNGDVKRSPTLSWREPHRVFAVACVSGGRTFTAGDPSGAIVVWDSQTGTSEAVLEGHDEAVLALTVLTSIDAVFSASADSTVRLWSLTTLQNNMVFEGHSGFVSALACIVMPESGTGLYTGSDDCTVRQWNINSGACVHIFRGHRAPVNAVLCRTDASFIISGSSDGMMKVWNASTFACVKTIGAHEGPIWSIVEVFEGGPHENACLATSSEDGKVRLWSDIANSVTLITEFSTTSERPVRCLLALDGVLFSGGSEGELFAWDIASRKVQAHFVFHTKTVTGLALSAYQLTSCGYDGHVCQWSVRDILEGPIQSFCSPATGNTMQRSPMDEAHRRRLLSSVTSGQQSRGRRYAITRDEVLQMYPELPLNYVIEELHRLSVNSRLAPEFLIFLVMLVCFGLLMVGMRPVAEGFYAVTSLEAQLTRITIPGFKLVRGFHTITSVRWFYHWMEHVLQQLWQTHAPDSYPTISGNNILVSALRLRVKRVTGWSCQWNPYVLRASDTEVMVKVTKTSPELRTRRSPRHALAVDDTPACYGAWSKKNEDTDPYICPQSSTCSEVDKDACNVLGLDPTIGFSYTPHTAGRSFQSVLHHYGGGGYVTDFIFSQPYETQQKRLHALDQLGFMDEVATRFVDLGLFVYNPGLQAFIFLHMVCEVPYTGAWFPVVLSQVFEVHNTSTMAGRLGLHIFLLLLVAVFSGLWVWDFVRAVRGRSGLAQLLCFSVLVDAVNNGLFIGMMVFYFRWVVASKRVDLQQLIHASIIVDTTLQDGQGSQEVLYSVLHLYGWYLTLGSCCAVLMFIKAIQYLSRSSYFEVLTRTVYRTRFMLVGVLALLLIQNVGFALASHILFGRSHIYFFRYGAAFGTLIRWLTGDDSIYDKILINQRISTITFYWAYQVILQVMLLTFLLAVLTDGYREITSSTRSVPLLETLQQLLSYMVRQFSWQVIERRWQLYTELHTTEGGIVDGIRTELLRIRRGMVDPLAVQRHDFDEVETVTLQRSDMLDLMPAQVRTNMLRSVLEGLWADMTWNFHLRCLANKGRQEVEREALLFEEIQQALRRLTGSFGLLEDVNSKLNGLEMAVRTAVSVQ